MRPGGEHNYFAEAQIAVNRWARMPRGGKGGGKESRWFSRPLRNLKHQDAQNGRCCAGNRQSSNSTNARLLGTWDCLSRESWCLTQPSLLGLIISNCQIPWCAGHVRAGVETDTQTKKAEFPLSAVCLQTHAFVIGVLWG